MKMVILTCMPSQIEGLLHTACIIIWYQACLFSLHPKASDADSPTYPSGLRLFRPPIDGAGILALAV